MLRKRRRKASVAKYDSEFSDPAPRRRRRRFPWLIALLIFLAAIVILAPQIVAHPSIRQPLVRWAVPAELNIGNVEAGWLKPLVLTDVALLDANRDQVLHVTEIRSQRRLLDLATDYRNLGKLFVDQPTLQLVLTEHGSNLSQLLQALAQDASPQNAQPTTSSPASFSVAVTGGQVNVEDRVTQQSCAARNIELTLNVPAGNESPWQLDLVTDTVQAGKQGRLAADVQWNLPSQITSTDLGNGQVVLHAHQFPLPIAAALVARSVPDLRLQGRLDSDLTCRWQSAGENPALEARGRIDLQSAQFAMASVLGSDEIQAASISAELEAQVDQQQLVIQRCDTTSDFGDLRLQGEIPLSELLATDWQAALLSNASTHQLLADGTVDVARLASMLPETLRLRAGTHLTEGQLRLHGTSQREEDQRILRADLATTTLVGTANGQPIRWDEPVRMEVIARPQAGQLAIDRLQASSSFLNLSATGDVAGGRFEASGDLQAMLGELSKFSDFGSLQLAGNLQVEGSWEVGNDGRASAQATAHINDFAAATSQLPRTSEPAIVISTQLTGVWQDQTMQSLDAASLQLDSGQDRLVLQLTQPVAAPNGKTEWPVRIEMQGRAESWQARLQPLVSLDAWHMFGNLNAAAQGSLSPTRVTLQPIDIELAQLEVMVGNQKIVEPSLKLNGSASWNPASQRVTIPTANLASNTLAAAVKDVDVALDPAAFQATGTVSYRADLQRLWTLTADADNPPTVVPQGQLSGTAQLATSAQRVRFRGDTTIDNFAVYTFSQPTATTPAGWNQTWREPQVQIQSTGEYDQPQDRLQLDQLTVRSETAQLEAQGGLDRLTTAPFADLRGNVNYDWQQVLTKLRRQIGPQIQVVGKHRQPFTIRGPLTSPSVSAGQPGQLPKALAAAQPLVPADLTADVSLAWDQAAAYGLSVGPQQLAARLNQRQLVFQPVQLAVQTQPGQPTQALLATAPRIDLSTPNALLLLDQSTALQNVELTPQLCDNWLKYVNPLLAGAATASGRLSAQVAGARVPLTNPVAADLAATVAIDHARVSPGPLAKQILSISQQVGSLLQKDASKLSFLRADQTWLEMNGQQVQVQMSGGRVYHQNLEMLLGEVTVRSQGWVAADQSLSVVAEITILDKWVGNEKFLAGMRGKSVQIPIHGTFSQPRIDQRALAQLSSQLIGNTAEQFLQDELQKGLQKLLGPK